MKTLFKICFILLVIGGLNWGLVGIFNFNLVEVIFGGMSIFTRLIYTLVGVSAVVCIFKK